MIGIWLRVAAACDLIRCGKDGHRKGPREPNEILAARYAGQVMPEIDQRLEGHGGPCTKVVHPGVGERAAKRLNRDGRSPHRFKFSDIGGIVGSIAAGLQERALLASETISRIVKRRKQSGRI